MQELFIYLLQVNVLLSLIFLGYHFLLRRLTFYRLNRFYFLIGTGYALLYPFIDFDTVRTLTASTSFSLDHYQELFFGVASLPRNSLNLLEVLLYGIGVGSCFFLLQTGMGLKEIYRVHRRSFAANWKGFSYREVGHPILPFSFFKQIYVHKTQHSQKELAAIFTHESLHVKGRHTFDILGFELLQIGCWFNPFVWLMQRAVQQNLEFLTDERVLEKGMDRQAYQYTLVRAAQRDRPRPFLGSTFSFKPLKNRIMMMNKKRSQKFQLGKYALLLPVFVFIGVGFTTTKAAHQIEQLTQKVQQTQWSVETISPRTQEERPLVIIDGREAPYEVYEVTHPDHIERVNVLKGASATDKYGARAKHGVIEVTLKKHKERAVNPPAQEKEPMAKEQKSAQPLYRIDGQRKTAEEVQDLDPNQIQSIDVLKGAAALKAFGEEGKNGAVLILLKKE